MSDNDPLSNLLGSFRRKKGQDADIDFSRPAKPEGEKGLNPLDLLALPPEQRDLVNFLSRRKQATIETLQEHSALPLDKLAAVLNELKSTGYIHEALVDGNIFYRVVFGGKVSRSGRGVPQDIWDAVDLDNTVFLKQVSLFQTLSDEDRQEIAAHMEARRYKRSEVILWQGDIGDGIYFIKSGIVGISRLTPESSTRETEILAYLKQGDLLGEHNLLTDHIYPASTTATALSEVELLVMGHEIFMDLLRSFDEVALRLAKVIAERIVDVNARLSSKGADVKASIVIGTGQQDITPFGSHLAMTLAHVTNRRAVYTEHPNPGVLHSFVEHTQGKETYQHPAGFDIAAIQGSPGLPASVRTTLVMDRLFNDYSNVVIGLSAKIDENTTYMLEKANQVIVVCGPNETDQINALVSNIRSHIHPERTNILTAIQADPDDYDQFNDNVVDFIIPQIASQFSLRNISQETAPPDIANITHALADRLGRTNQIGVYIPTTTDVDQVMDTTTYIDKTISFLGRLFGGEAATSSKAHGVWNSEEVGLVSEAIYIVRTFVTQAELDRYLGDVLEYVEQLKEELSQEAMAVEVNQKLMLI